MLSYFIKLCWKNIWRSKRRTFITINSIAIAVTFLVLLHNYYDGLHDQIVQNVIRYHSGHLMISEKGYHEHNSTQLYLPKTSEYTDWLQKQPEVKSFGERVLVNGLISSAKGSANILFAGINPEREKQVTHFWTNITSGVYVEQGAKKQIVIGKTLASLLGVDIGSKVVALTQGVDGSIGNELFKVVGIFDSQSDADKALAFIDINEARLLMSIKGGTAHQISVILQRENQIEEVKSKFEKDFSVAVNAPKKGVEIFSWSEVQRHVKAMIELDKAVNRLLMMIILCVASLGIANSILMSIMERTREIGVMLAVGTRKWEVVRMVVAETLMMSFVGVALGNMGGALATLFFNKYGFDLKWFTSQKLVIDVTIVQTISYPIVHWDNSLMVSLVVLLLSFIVSIFPARYIVRLNPVKALRAN